jgi:UDP-N-acetylmuramoyl-tripeptide--D-alanyl-D-alanine ligase
MYTENLEKIYKVFLKKKSIKIDSRNIKKGDIFFTLKGENFDGNNFVKSVLDSGADLVILDDKKQYKKLEKKYSEKIILVKNSLKTLQDLAKKYRSELKIPFLGITGSNGKTTTKELVKKVLSQKFNVLATTGNLNNHIGVPLTILSIKPRHNFAVIEMGANHIGEIKVLAEISKPTFGIITNIGKAHIGEFKNLNNIIKTKKELYDEVFKNSGVIFINSEDEVLQKISSQFSVTQKVLYPKGKTLDSKKFLKIEINNKTIKTKIIGEYNLENFSAAFSVGKFFKISEKKIISALESYNPKNNRSEIEKTKKNKNTII